MVTVHSAMKVVGVLRVFYSRMQSVSGDSFQCNSHSVTVCARAVS